MATAKKLPSGSWRVQVFSHYEIVDGKKKRRYQSFTSKDKTRAGKREAERMAAEWLYKRQERHRSVTLLDAVNSYIDVRRGVASPSTIRAYLSYKKHHLDDIGTMDINRIDQTRLQLWVSQMSVKLSPKTVKEIVNMVKSAYHEMAGQDLPSLTLPMEEPKEKHTPSDEDVKELYESLDEDLKLCLLLAAFCSLRRCEVCALDRADFRDGFVRVSKIMVRDVPGDWIVKKPKTPESIRDVPVPDRIMKMVEGRTGKLVPFVPDQITKKFRNAIMKQGKLFTYHDLRHYYASIAHYLGIPDAYIMANGGWSSEYVMKRVYREALKDKRKEQNDKIADHFKKVL